MRRELARLEKKITDTAVARFRKSEPVMSPQTEETEESPEPQIPNLDAQAVVFSSKDQMHAWLFIYPPVGEGREVDRPMLNQAMRENEVVYGIDEALLQSLPQSSRRYFQLYYAAAGKQPARMVMWWRNSPERPSGSSEWMRTTTQITRSSIWCATWRRGK